MKTLTLTLLSLILTLTLNAQKKNEIPKGATKIVVNTGKKAEDNYKYVISKLMDKGIYVDKKDPELFYIKTQPATTKKLTITYFLNVIAKDDEVIISGMMKSGFELSLGSVTSTDEFEPITKRGMKGSIYMVSFSEMNDIASNIGEISKYL